MAAAEFSKMFDVYKAAVFGKDVEALMALYDGEARVFDIWGTWSHEGAGAWRAAVADWFGSLGSERVVVEFSGVWTAVAGDLAAAHAFVNYGAVSDAGETLRQMRNRLTWVARLKNGAWKIVHEHTSAPIDVATGKAMVRH